MLLSGHSWCFYFSCPGVASMFPRVRMYVFFGVAFVVVPVLGRQPRRLARVSLPCVLRPAFHSPPSHRRAPASPLPRRRAVNADKRYPRTRSLPHFCSSRNSVNQFVLFNLYYAKPYNGLVRQRYKKCYHTHEKCFFVVETLRATSLHSFKHMHFTVFQMVGLCILSEYMLIKREFFCPVHVRRLIYFGGSASSCRRRRNGAPRTQ